MKANIWHLKCCSAPLLSKSLRSLHLGFSRPTGCAIKFVSRAEKTLPSRKRRLTFLCWCCVCVLFPILCFSSLLKSTPYISDFKVFTFLCVKANKMFKWQWFCWPQSSKDTPVHGFLFQEFSGCIDWTHPFHFQSKPWLGGFHTRISSPPKPPL